MYVPLEEVVHGDLQFGKPGVSRSEARKPLELLFGDALAAKLVDELVVVDVALDVPDADGCAPTRQQRGCTAHTQKPLPPVC